MLKRTQQEQGFNEPTDTVVWSAIIEQGIDPYDALLWNIFPFHPHKADEPLTNRTPTESEQQLGWEYTKRLLALHTELGGPKPLVLAVGQKSADTMGRFGLSAIGLRHPANGDVYRRQVLYMVYETRISFSYNYCPWYDGYIFYSCYGRFRAIR